MNGKLLTDLPTAELRQILQATEREIGLEAAAAVIIRRIIRRREKADEQRAEAAE